MYIHKQKAKKKFTPVNLHRRQSARIRAIAIFLTSLCVLAAGVLGAKKLWDYYNSVEGQRLLAFRAQKITIIAPSKELETQVSKFIKISAGDNVSSAEVRALESTLNANIKQVKSIEVSRKIFDKELVIKIEKYIPLARLKAGNGIFYTTAEGRIFQDDTLADKESVPTIFLNGTIKSEFFAKELVELLKELYASSTIILNGALLDVQEQTFNISLKDGQVKLSNFNTAPTQIRALTKILEIAQDKGFEKPFFIDFTYFADGKIYLKQKYI